MANVDIQTTVIGNNYDRVIDTEFKTFGVNVTGSLNQVTVEEFFQIYEDLFYQIPKEGNTESHQYILTKTTEYLGVRLADDESIQALLDEIDNLKRQILETNKTVSDLLKTTK